MGYPGVGRSTWCGGKRKEPVGRLELPPAGGPLTGEGRWSNFLWKEDRIMENEASVVRKRKHLSPEEKFQIFLEATMAKAKDNGSVSEVMRRWGIHSSDLVRIKRTIEQNSLEAFRERKSRKAKVDYEAYQHLQVEKQRLEAVILEQAAELALLKKKDRSA